MSVQHGRQVRILTCVLAAVAVAFTWAGAVAPAWSAAHGMTTRVRPPGAGDASAIGAARLAGSWGRAIEVPGLGALNTGRHAEVSSVSCGSAGSCAAGGVYRDRSGHLQGFVAVERNGLWGRAIEVPGLGALNTGGDAEVTSVSCASAGNCAAGGYYRDRTRSPAGVRGRRAERPLGPGDRGARPGGPEHGRVRPRLLGVVRLGGQLRGRRVTTDRRAHVWGSWPSSGTAAGAGRSRCPAWRR